MGNPAPTPKRPVKQFSNLPVPEKALSDFLAAISVEVATGDTVNGCTIRNDPNYGLIANVTIQPPATTATS